MVDAYSELSRTDLAERAELLGFRDDDRECLLAAADRALRDQALLAEIGRRAAVLIERIGVLDRDGDDPWAGYDPEAGLESGDPGADGVMPLLALLVAVDAVRAFHAGRGIPDDVSWRSLSDLGQQVWVHRLTYDRFGLHTFGWLRVAWSGALYWLGRLQFNLQRDTFDDGVDKGWVISTHIPRTGPLTPAGVEESIAAAVTFFDRHFPEIATTTVFCHSWLLDPELSAGLATDSNMARFQRLWRLRDEGRPADGDALFFTFSRRGDVDLDTLPQDTSLQRLIVKRLRAGDHWRIYSGTVPIEPYRDRAEAAATR
ncbi:acyltransferase domain-containing protein [Microlunatus speluncae]|uniref:acyltransferase domain-containing protein n=1 Tax=Microlunatus speluncae TaxID=2594267 RepID=UPI0012662982|nr:acyltransferase domain-containing protein [Microlunatus speluncae]